MEAAAAVGALDAARSREEMGSAAMLKEMERLIIRFRSRFRLRWDLYIRWVMG